MRVTLKHALSAILFAALASTSALAREDFCLNADGSVNKTATQGYRKIEDNRNEATMRRINGVWFNRTTNPFTSQISDLWQVYEGRGAQSGLFSYFNRVCDRAGFCSNFEGTGLWAVQGTVRKFSGMRIVSDLGRDHFCQLLDGRLSDGNGVWRISGGGQLLRVNRVGQYPQ